MISENQIIRLIFGFKVRFLRQQKELSYQELSKLTGLSTSYLNDIEKGKRYPKPNKITALAGALGVDYNYMVATNASKQLQPVIDLFNSEFFKLFPLEEFGISTEKALELFIQTPEKVSSFISTILRLARNYQVDEKEFYTEALRSYQDMHNNYFPELESAVHEFKAYYSLPIEGPFTPAFLEEQLQELYGIKTVRGEIGNQPSLKGIRSYFQASSKILHLRMDSQMPRKTFFWRGNWGFNI